jgi:hypothetical protein
MKKIIVAICPRDGNVTPIELAAPIHERKAVGSATKLRKQADDMIATALVGGDTSQSKVLRQCNGKSKRTIRLAIGKQFVTETGQRFLRVLMWVKMMVCDTTGKLVERYHRFRLNYALPTTATT